MCIKQVGAERKKERKEEQQAGVTECQLRVVIREPEPAWRGETES